MSANLEPGSLRWGLRVGGCPTFWRYTEVSWAEMLGRKVGQNKCQDGKVGQDPGPSLFLSVTESERFIVRLLAAALAERHSSSSGRAYRLV